MAGKKRNRSRRTAQKALVRGIRLTRRLVGKAPSKRGLPPGTLVHTGEQRVEHTRMHAIRFGPDTFREWDVERPDDCFPPADAGTVTWLNVDGLHDVELLGELGRLAGLHPLALEDVVSLRQRPKQEDYDTHVYIVLRMLDYDAARGEVTSEQISLIVGANFVISFQEAPGDVWDSVRERLRNAKSGFRARGADYLAYALMDSIVDAYFKVVEMLGDQLEQLEMQVMDQPNRASIHAIHRLKGELLVMRKAVWPLRDVFNSLLRDEDSPFGPGTRIYLRDLHDHTFQIIDAVETMRDITGGLIDLYLSSMSNRMNEVMKVLTLIATLFIPLTFIVGVYGMNFDYLPELHWKWSYPVLWVMMIVVVLVMLSWFRRKGWFD